MTDSLDFLTSGWSGLNARQPVETNDEREQRAVEEYRINQTIHRVFVQSADGREILEYYRQRTVEQPPFNPDLKVNPAEQGFFRSGENNIIHDIERRCRKAEQGPPQLRTPART